MIRTRLIPLAAAALLLALPGMGAVAQQRAETAAAQAQLEPDVGQQSRYGDVPQFGGPGSVGADLREDHEVKETLFRFDGLQRTLKPYFDYKGRINERNGLALSFDYTALYQGASESAGEDDAASGIFRFYGSWTALGRESGNTGSLVYKIENRHKLGTEIVPQDLGFSTGYAGLTAAPFTDIRWALTNLFWQQRLAEGRVTIQAGVVDTTDYVDVYGLTNPWTQFSNLAFLTDPTIPAPNQGLGAVVGAMLTPNVYAVGGIADSNGDPTEPDDFFSSFFDDAEFFSHIEVGWTPSQERIYFDNAHLTYWHADERELAGVKQGWGLAFSATRFIDETWMPFLRLGYAEDGGALWDRSVGLGLGYYRKARSDLLGFGVNWSRPSETGVGPGLDDQYTAELFYRLQLSQNFALTPDVQLLIDPALTPEQSSIWVFGLRARLAL